MALNDMETKHRNVDAPIHELIELIDEYLKNKE